MRDQTSLPSRPSHWNAFVSPEAPEVFHSVCHRHQIWKPDRFDVASIHREARELFESLVEKSTTPLGTEAGRILLLLGESGAGKTHLMRAFRRYVHGHDRGYCAYMQMTASTEDYARYVLSNLIDSLDRPYNEPLRESSGLMSLSTDLLDALPVSNGDAQRLRDVERDLSDQELGDLTNKLIDELLEDERFKELDHNLLRALLYLQRPEARIRLRVLSYLRCEDLTDYDRSILGGIVPRLGADDSQRTVEQFGKLIWALRNNSLVILVDQLEDIYNLSESEQKFRRAMSTLCDLHDRVPSSIIVVSCLEDYYQEIKTCLAEPHRFRLEKDPDVARLKAERTESEVLKLVAHRLHGLYAECDLEPPQDDGLYPFPHDELKKLAGTTTRHLLDWCRTVREQAIRTGRVEPPDTREGPGPGPQETSPAIVKVEQDWNDFRSADHVTVPEEPDKLTGILTETVAASAPELDGLQVDVHREGQIVTISLGADTGLVERVSAAVCNKNPQGGALAKQIRWLWGEARGASPVAIRSTDFPSNPKTKVAQLLGEFISDGGRRVVVEDADWRTMLAFSKFVRNMSDSESLAKWQRQEKPLTQLKTLRVLLNLDELPSRRRLNTNATGDDVHETDSGTVSEPDETVTRVNVPWDRAVSVGKTMQFDEADVPVPVNDFTRHAAFLGGTGSGKTTLALNIIEQLVAHDIPALLIDRKGDLCGYADSQWWQERGTGEEDRHKQELASKLDVALFTPGNPDGRPLAIQVVPAGMAEMSEFDRAKTARCAAAALEGMMSYGGKQTREKSLAILTQAIRLLGSFGENPPTLQSLIQMISTEDPALVGAIGALNAKNFRNLAENLQALAINRGALLSSEGEPLDIDTLFGRGKNPGGGKTRLSIISTKFIGDNSDIEFWVTQLLLEIARWASQHPEDAPQAVVLFDEADMYLPATRKPATKEPMEDLLKRARSAGLCTFLATQSPGDMDYKCRDNIRSWFIGRVRERTAVNKLKPNFHSSVDNLESRLANQKTGEFHLVYEGAEKRLRAHRSLLRTRQYTEDEILELAAQTRRHQPA